MRPQWLVRPPSMRAANQRQSPVPTVYGSPSMSQPPMQPSNSPNGFLSPPQPRLRRLVVPLEHRAVLGRVPHRAALEHHDVGAGLGQHLGRRARRRRPSRRCTRHRPWALRMTCMRRDCISQRADSAQSQTPAPARSARRRRSAQAILRLLLRHAVDRAHAPDEVLAGDRHDAAIGEEPRQRVDRLRVVGDGRRRAAARRRWRCRSSRSSPAAARRRASDAARHRQLDDLIRPPGRIPRQLEPAQVVLQRRVVRVGRIVLDRADDGPRRDEARDVVDVAVGVVAGDALAEPQHLADAEEIAQRAFQVGPRLARVAVGVQQALLRRHHDAGAVDVDRSAFEHQPRLEHRHAAAAAPGARGTDASRISASYLPPHALKPHAL